MKKNIVSALAAAGVTAGLVLSGFAVNPAFALATLPSTDTIYVITCDGSFDDLTLLSVTSDGTSSSIGNGDGNLNGKCAAGAAWDKAAQAAYFTSYNVGTGNMDVWTTAVTDGTPSFVSTLSTGTSSEGGSISINSAGAAQVVDNGVFFDANLISGAETEIAASQVNGTNGFYYIIQAFNQFDGKLYAINADDTEDDVPPLNNMLYTVDPSTGVVFGNSGPHISGLPDVGNVRSLAFDSAGIGWAVANAADGNEHLWSFDVATATFVDQGPLLYNGNSFNTSGMFISQPVTSPSPSLPNTGLDVAPVAGLGVFLAVGGAVALVLIRRRTAG